MASTNTARSRSVGLEQADRGRPDASTLDASTRARVQHVCNFINGEVARRRLQVIAVGTASLVGMVLLPIVIRIIDVRIAIVVAAGLVTFWSVRARGQLSFTYRSIGIKRLVAAANKTLAHKHPSSLTREQFVSLDLFPAPKGPWRNGHEIRGRLGNAAFSVHDVRTDVFRGAMIRLEFATSFPGHTVVFPERQGPGGGGRSHAKRDLVLVKNPEFEQMFSAYATAYMPARRFFTPGLTRLLLAGTETFGSDLRLAFVGRALYVAVPHVALLPEVTLLSHALTPEDAAGPLLDLAAFGGALAREVGSTL